MGKITGFLELDRKDMSYAPAAERIQHYGEFMKPLADPEVQAQAGRCMDCGVPYCHGPTGCPVHNQIPDWNDLVYSGDFEEAARNLHSTNNFPEFTGRICPAPCEEACTLNLDDAPVTIKSVEQVIADKAWENSWVKPQIPTRKTGKKIAVIGSGPAGLAAAQQLARVGHEVHVYEREPKAGGLMRYGIPDFKMEKHAIERRVAQIEAEGAIFHYGVNIGVNTTLASLEAAHDAVLFAVGAERPRDPGLPGIDILGDLPIGVHRAMEFLVQQNRRVGGEPVLEEDILATGKNVVVIGGGDTASDCIGTSIRQGASVVTQLDIRPTPPLKEDKLMVWPYWATKFRTSSSQAEGAEREFSCATLGVVVENGKATGVKCARVDAKRVPIAGSEFIIPADLVLIAIGFSGPELKTFFKETGERLAQDKRTNIKADTDSYATSLPKVFAAGDCRRGQSLVVWAIREGRQAARAIDEFLMGSSDLPR